MLTIVSLQLPKAAVRCISSSIPARVLQQTPTTSSSNKTKPLQVSQGEKAWCDVYGVDYEQQIQEALQESPAATESATKQDNHPTVTSAFSAKSQGKADIWTTVFDEKKSG